MNCVFWKTTIFSINHLTKFFHNIFKILQEFDKHFFNRCFLIHELCHIYNSFQQKSRDFKKIITKRVLIAQGDIFRQIWTMPWNAKSPCQVLQFIAHSKIFCTKMLIFLNLSWFYQLRRYVTLCNEKNK